MLVSQGHINAGRYELGKLWMEAELAGDRINEMIVTEAVVLHTAFGAAMHPSKKATKQLTEMLKEIQSG